VIEPIWWAMRMRIFLRLDTLEVTRKGGMDVTPWLSWFLACLGHAFEGAEATLASVMTKVRFWEQHRDAPFNGRQRAIINRLLNGFAGKLTTSKWALLAKCSQNTALRDIDDLMARGVLARNAAGGRSTSYSLTIT
jgi:Fic family protein